MSTLMRMWNAYTLAWMIASRSPVTSSVLYSLAGLHVVVVRLEPGAEVPLHRHEHKDEIFDVVYGCGMLGVHGGWEEGRPGALVVVPRDSEHGLRNTSREPWIIRETVRERLYTKGSVRSFLGPRRPIRDTHAILDGPCRGLSDIEDLPLDAPWRATDGAHAVRPAPHVSDTHDCLAEERCQPRFWSELPLPDTSTTERRLFSVSGLRGAVIRVRAGTRVDLGVGDMDDRVYDPVCGRGRFVRGTWSALLTTRTVAMLPAGHRAAIDVPEDDDLVLRVTTRRRPTQLEIMRMVRRAIARRIGARDR